MLLDTLPAEWDTCKKFAATVRDGLGPHMAEQEDRILREEDEFRTKARCVCPIPSLCLDFHFGFIMRGRYVP